MAEFFINGFLVFLLAVIAIIAIQSIKVFSTVMLAGAYSLISAIIFVSLDAVDVAFTEAAVGAGLSTVLYIAAMKHLPKREKVVNDNTIFALVVCLVVGCLLVWASSDLNFFSKFIQEFSNDMPFFYGLFSIMFAVSLGIAAAFIRRFISNFKKKLLLKS